MSIKIKFYLNKKNNQLIGILPRKELNCGSRVPKSVKVMKRDIKW